MLHRFLFLGTGGSMGIPVLGCKCPVCTSNDPHNTRYRSSALVKIGGLNLLIDAGPDLRAQLFHHKVDHLDGLLLTHHHYDHTAGLDEIRAFNMHIKKPIPCLLSQDTYEDLKIRFYYIFGVNKEKKTFVPSFDVTVLNGERGSIDFVGVPIRYTTFYQLGIPVNGYIFGDLAYLSDISKYPESLFEDLKGIKTLVVSALRFTPSPMHFTIDEAIDFARKVGAERTYFTHIAHEVEHEHTNSYLPENIRLAYDGLEIDFNM